MSEPKYVNLDTVSHMNRKIKSFKQIVSVRRSCSVKSYNNCSKGSLLALKQTHNHNSFIAVSLIRCSKPAQKFAVWVFEFTIVVVETMQLVVSQFEHFLLL